MGDLFGVEGGLLGVDVPTDRRYQLVSGMRRGFGPRSQSSCLLKYDREIGTVLLDRHFVVGVHDPLRGPVRGNELVVVREHRSEVFQESRSLSWMGPQVRDRPLDVVVIGGHLLQQCRQGCLLMIVSRMHQRGGASPVVV